MGIIEKSSNLNPFEAIGKIVDIIQKYKWFDPIKC